MVLTERCVFSILERKWEPRVWLTTLELKKIRSNVIVLSLCFKGGRQQRYVARCVFVSKKPFRESYFHESFVKG